MMDCKNCTKASVYNADPVPFVVHENMRAQMDSANKRLSRILVLLIVLLFITNGLWVWYESGFMDEQVTVRQINDNGYNNYIGNDGDITNGVSGSNN